MSMPEYNTGNVPAERNYAEAAKKLRSRVFAAGLRQNML